MRRVVLMVIMFGLCLPAVARAQTTDQLSNEEVRNRLSDLLQDLDRSEPSSAVPAVGARKVPMDIQWLDYVPQEPIDWEEKPFDEIVDWFSDQKATGAPVNMNVIVKRLVLEEAGVDTELEVTLKVRDLSLRELLKLVLEQVGGSDPVTKLGFIASGNVLVITTQEDMNREMFVKTYDVTDLVINKPDFVQAPEMDISQLQERQGQGSRGGGGGTTGGQLFRDAGGQRGGEEDKRSVRMDKLIETIQDTIKPDSWTKNGGEGTIGYNNAMLIVYNTIEVHQMIQQDYFGGIRR